MNEYITFAQNNPILVIGFLVVLGLIIWTEYSVLTRKYKQLDTNAAVTLINRDEAVVLDVREDSEIKEGKIQDARHIALGQLPKRLGELDKYKERPVLVYCRTGQRSGGACNTLVKNGFTNVHNLSGGIAAWETANLPVSKR